MGLSTSRFVLAASGVTLALLGGCAGGHSPGQVDQAHVHAGGVHVVAETPGTCPICEVYEFRRDSVVRIRAGSSLGTGVAIDNKGTVLTNAHVVGDSPTVTLETYRGDMIRGAVVRRGMGIDLALISADPTDIQWQGVMPIAEDPPVVGSKVYVIGHPAGLGWTLTEGIISARRRVAASARWRRRRSFRSPRRSPPATRAALRLMVTDTGSGPLPQSSSATAWRTSRL
jgi:putative serine protease PepD